MSIKATIQSGACFHFYLDLQDHSYHLELEAPYADFYATAKSIDMVIPEHVLRAMGATLDHSMSPGKRNGDKNTDD